MAEENTKRNKPKPHIKYKRFNQKGVTLKNCTLTLGSVCILLVSEICFVEQINNAGGAIENWPSAEDH
ncbi:hypothetical protein [Acidisoma sp. 7E03]